MCTIWEGCLEDVTSLEIVNYYFALSEKNASQFSEQQPVVRMMN